MSPGTGRTTPSNLLDGQRRLGVARKYWEMAEILDAEESDPVARTEAVGLAVLAGIAAADSACISRLGQYARGQDHAQAATLLTTINPGGREAAKSLRLLLGLKDKAHYGFGDLGLTETKRAIRAAGSLVEFGRGFYR